MGALRTRVAESASQYHFSKALDTKRVLSCLDASASVFKPVLLYFVFFITSNTFKTFFCCNHKIKQLCDIVSDGLLFPDIML